MIALAVELTSRRAGLGLVDHHDTVHVDLLPPGRRNSGQLVDRAAKLMKRHGLLPTQLDAIYLSNGPGAFTGTRVAVTFTKFLAHVAGAQVVAVPTAEVVVNHLPALGQACVVFDARRGTVWASVVHGRGWSVASRRSGRPLFAQVAGRIIDCRHFGIGRRGRVSPRAVGGVSAMGRRAFSGR